MEILRQSGRRIGSAIRGTALAVLGLLVLLLAVPLALVAGLVTMLTGECRRHDEAWAPLRERGATGLTSFQTVCEQRLVEATGAVGVNLANRTVSAIPDRGQPTDAFDLVWSIEGTPLTVGVYPDGAEILGPNVHDLFEEWDARTPDELIDDVCRACVRRATEYRQDAV